MDKKSLSGKDLLLALLYVPGINESKNEPIIGRTKLTKMMFLFDKEIYNKFFKDKVIDLPCFDPYLFGPFSKDLFDDLKFFLSIGLIQTEETDILISAADKYELSETIDESIVEDDWSDATFDSDNTEDVELKYFLSDNGLKYVEEKIWGEFTDIQQADLKLFKSKINAISLDALLRYVYNKYPEYTTKSVIVDKYLKKDIDG